MALFDADNGGKRVSGGRVAVVSYRAVLAVTLAMIGWFLSSMRDDIKSNLSELGSKVDDVKEAQAATAATVQAQTDRIGRLEVKTDRLGERIDTITERPR